MSLDLRQTHVGHCLDLLRQMSDESVNCVVSSPPYWGLRAYGTVPQVWGGDPGHRHRFARKGRARGRNQRGPASDASSTLYSAQPREQVPPPSAAGVFCSCGAWQGELGREPDPFLFIDHMVEICREVRRVLRPDGTLWLNLGDSFATGAGRVGEHPGGGAQGAIWRGTYAPSRGYRGDRLANGRGDQQAVLRRKTRATRDGSHAGKNTAMAAAGPMQQPNRLPIPGFKPKDLIGIPWRVAFALQADGWWFRGDIIWKKPNPMPESVRDRPTRAHEYLFLLTKSANYFYDWKAIREPQLAPEASTPDDAARAFSRRRATATEQRQEALTADAISERRRTSGNLARKYRQEHGGPEDRKTHQAHTVPWTDTDGMRNKRSVWTVATEPYGGAHFAAFPKKLVEPCILAGCPAGGVVLDPFGGSGTVGEVAEALGRNWILFDLNPAYAELAAKRTAQRGLFVEATAEAAT